MPQEPHHRRQRDHHLQAQLQRSWQSDGSLDGASQLWFTRGLRKSPFGALPCRDLTETFVWLVRPEGGYLEGTVYTDGSLLDHKPCFEGHCVALGWAFAVFDTEGRMVAAAQGCPPPWVNKTSHR